MNRRVAVVASGGLALGFVIACSQNIVAVDDVPRPDDPADASTGPSTGPYDITCDVYVSPATSDVTDRFTVRSDATGHDAISLEGHGIDIDYAPSPDAPSLEGTLIVTSTEHATEQRYRLLRTNPPPSFIGDFGFTGLVYIGPHLQYRCTATPSGVFANDTSPTPFDVGCTVEVRNTIDGSVERTETFDTTSPEDQTFDFDGIGVRFYHTDTPYDGRALRLSAWVGGPVEDSNANVAQLFQIPRTARLGNPLADGTFFGRTTVFVGSGREATYSCAAR